jgi:hypothetical protein
MSLADPTNSTPSVLHLPVGHPFLNDSDLYWAADHIPDDLSDGSLLVIFKSTFSVAGAFTNHTGFSSAGVGVWCVRGGAGTRTR